MNKYLHLCSDGAFGIVNEDTDANNWHVTEPQRVWRLDENGPVEIDKPKPPPPFNDWDRRLAELWAEMAEHNHVRSQTDSLTRNAVSEARSYLSAWRRLYNDEHGKS